MNKKSQIILVFVGLVFLFCLTSCAGILNEIFGLEPINIEDTIFDTFVVYRINDSYSYIDCTIPEDFNKEVLAYNVIGSSYYDASNVDYNEEIPNIFSEQSYYDGWSLGVNGKYSETITPDNYKKINSLTCSYDSFWGETTFSWDLGEFPAIAESFAISKYNSYVYSSFDGNIDSSSTSITVSGNYMYDTYYLYFEYADGNYYCLGKFE